MNSAATVVRRIPNGLEVVIVMVVAFCWFIYESMRWFFQTLREYGWTTWESGTVLGSRVGYLAERAVLFEIFFFLMLFAFLKRRGWTWSDLKLPLGMPSAWHAVVLFAAVYAIHFIVFKGCAVSGLIYPGTYLHLGTVFDFIYPETYDCVYTWENTNYYTWLPALVIDAFYWEFFLLRYLFQRLENAIPFVIIGLSAGVRFLCYVYEGPYGWISILLLSVSMGWYYWKFKNLTVPIIVHALWNFVTFGFYTTG